jgi:hypothetical protein
VNVTVEPESREPGTGEVTADAVGLDGVGVGDGVGDGVGVGVGAGVGVGVGLGVGDGVGVGVTPPFAAVYV